MKREHITSQSYIDWLKSLGCVFCAPLTLESGFEDLISGTTGTKTSQGSVSWDSTYNAYYFHAPNGYCSMIFSGVNAFIGNNLPFPYTMLYTALYTSAGQWDSICALGGDPATGRYQINNVGNIHYQDILNLGNTSRNIWYDLGSSCDGNSNVVKIYNNGTLRGNGRGLNSNQNDNYVKSNVSFTAANSYWYLKDVMVFNCELNLTTIRKIQGYE